MIHTSRQHNISTHISWETLKVNYDVIIKEIASVTEYAMEKAPTIIDYTKDITRTVRYIPECKSDFG